MIKKHGRLLSGALATALTVVNIGALNPITAFAGEEPAKASDGSVITFAEAGTLDDANLTKFNSAYLKHDTSEGAFEGVVNIKSGAVDGDNQVQLGQNTTLPAAYAVYTDEAGTGQSSMTAEQMLIWNDGTNDLEAGKDVYDSITVDTENKATLTGKYVTKAISLGVDLGDLSETGNSVEAVVKAFTDGGKTYLSEKMADGSTAFKALGAPVLSKDINAYGYTFAGWDLDSDEENVEIKAGATAGEQSTAIDAQYKDQNYTGEVTLTAVWESAKFNINVNVNNGDPQNNYHIENYVFEDGLSKAIAAPEYSGYTFLGFDLDGNKTIEETDIIPTDDLEAQTAKINAAYNGSAMTISAVWEGDKVTVYFDDNGMESGSIAAKQSIEFGKGTKLTAIPSGSDAPKKTGYKLDLSSAWIDESGNTFADKADAETLTYTDGKANLKLNWTEESYDVTLDSTGNIIKSISKKWKQEGSTSQVEYKQSVKYKKSVTLPKVVTDTAIEGNNEIEFTKQGFLGWDADGDGKADYASGETIPSVEKAMNLMAIFKAASVNITFDGNSADAGKMDPVSVEDGSTYTLPENEFTRRGYTFSGWEIGSNTYAAGAEITISGATTVKAKWTPIKYSVSFYNGEELISSIKNIDFDSTVTIPKSVEGVEAANFIGWSKTNGASEADIPQNEPVSGLSAEAGSTVKLYAVIAEVPLTVEFDNNNTEQSGVGDTAPTDVIVDKGKEFTLPIINVAVAKEAGYELAGWTKGQGFESEEAAKAKGAKILKAGTKTSIDESTKFYALFKVKEITVKFDGNGNTSGEIEDVKVTYNTSTGYYTITTTPDAKDLTKAGYTFANEWYYEEACSTKVDFSNLDYTEAVDDVITVYAKWNSKKYRIEFSKNSDTAEGTMADLVATADDTKKLTRNAFTNEDETVEFAGWALSANATEAEFKDEASWKSVIEAAALVQTGDDTITLYAVWTQTAEEAQKEADAAKADADAAKAEAEAQKDAADKATAAANEANDAKTAAENAKAQAETERDAAKAELAKTPKAQNNAVAASGETVTTKADGTATITNAAVPANGTYEVPSTVTVNGATYNVTKIEASAFKGNKTIKQVTIPATIEEIGKSAFQKASNLKKITISGKDVVIRKNAFKGINKKAKIVAKDKDTRANIKAKGGAPKSVKIKKK